VIVAEETRVTDDPRRLLESAHLAASLADPLICVGLDGAVVRFNRAAEQAYGYRAEEVLGAPVSNLVVSETAGELDEALAAVVQQRSARLSLTGRRADGRKLEMEGAVSPVIVDGRVVGALLITRDASEGRALVRQLLLTVRLLSETDGIAAVGTAPDGTITVFNRGAEQMLGYRYDEVVGLHTVHMLHDRAEVERRAAELGIEPGPHLFGDVFTSSTEPRDWTWIRKDGSRLTVSLTLRGILDGDGRPEAYLGIARDITEIHRAEVERDLAEQRFRVAFEHAPIGLAITGLRGEERGRFLQTNPELARMVGRRPGELDGVLVNDITHPDDRAATETAIEELKTKSISLEKRYLDRDGNPVWVLTRSTPVPGMNGDGPSYTVTQVLDISERRRFEGELHRLANHDPLTGLYNRRSFEAQLEVDIREAIDAGHWGALLFLDLDGFKNVNDRFGHSIGDELVTKVAELLRQSVREDDYVARIGGDEFAIIIRRCNVADAVTIAEKVLDTIRSRATVAAGGAPARVTTSVGIAMFGAGIETGGQQVAVEADIAMYDAKADGRNGYSVYDQGSQKHPDRSMRDSWYARLRRALDDDRFVLHAQPIVPICADDPTRYELLLRLQDESYGLIPPGAFLEDAERFDLIGEIDRWVLTRAVSLMHEHHLAGRDLSLAVNLSGKTMQDLGLVSDLAEILKTYPIPSGRLVIEITETAAIVHMERARELARELRKLGCLISLDDFGAGFSSFYYLKHLDFDYLKIDGEFIRNLANSGIDRLVVSAVVGIATGLGARTIAESVEDAQTHELLRELGVGFGQGFHLGRPEVIESVLPPI